MNTILIFALVGFLAQIIDGTLGMAYGVSANSFMLAFGIPPALASASIHAAECVTTGISGLSHLGFGNVDKKLATRLILPGIIGAVIGAYLLVNIPGDIIKPWVALYLVAMGALILYKGIQKPETREVHTHLIPLGLVGGFMDAIGGGGWGPIVVSTLVARGNHPRFSIGSVNLAEFFVAVAASITFFITMWADLASLWQSILGLAIGGAIAAPFAAFATKKLPMRPLLILVGVLIIGLSLRTLYLAWVK